MINSTPTFSIIVPVYKVEDYLDKCVNSLVHQSYDDIEIILVDDGSPDLCPEKCDKWAEIDKRIKVVHKKNGGLSDARNQGLNNANGEYVLFVDSDDYIEENTCEELYKFVEKKVDIIAIDAVSNKFTRKLIHLEKEDTTIYSGQAFIKKMAREGSMPMAAWLYIYKRKFLIDNELCFKVGILHEDEQFTPRAVLKADSIVNSGLKAYHYIIRDNSITTTPDKRKNLMDFYSTCQELKSLYDTVDDTTIKNYLLDSLVGKYLSIYMSGMMYKYGKEYSHKGFVIKNAKSSANRKKAMLFCASPRLYCYINNLSKRRKLV